MTWVYATNIKLLTLKAYIISIVYKYMYIYIYIYIYLFLENRGISLRRWGSGKGQSKAGQSTFSIT